MIRHGVRIQGNERREDGGRSIVRIVRLFVCRRGLEMTTDFNIDDLKFDEKGLIPAIVENAICFIRLSKYSITGNFNYI